MNPPSDQAAATVPHEVVEGCVDCPYPDYCAGMGQCDEWKRFDYENGEVIWQCECPDCDRGLLLAPARFCLRCNGSGYLTTTTDPT